MLQMFDHKLDPIKGWFQMYALDFTAKISANVTITAYKGRCVHLNSDGEFEMGCTGHQMPMFLFQSSDDTDVYAGNLGPTTDKIEGGMFLPEGRMMALVATGGFELATTEFDADQDYNPNDLLRAIASNSDQTTGGRLTNQGVVKVASASPQNATACVGLVSRGVYTNSHKKEVLAFWPIHELGANGL